MLQKLRDKTTGWVATAIIMLLMVPFAFFGMEQYLFQQNDTAVAKIQAPPKWWSSAPSFWPMTMLWQRVEITPDEFRTAFEQARQQQRESQGEGFDAREFEDGDNKRRILDELIDQRVLQMASDRAGIAVGDTLVRDTIQGIPAFQVAGKFDPQAYRLALAAQVPARTPREFEQMVRDDLQQSLLPSRVAQSAFVTPVELERVLKLLGEKRSFSFVGVPAPTADTAPVTAAEIKRWYETHPDDYRMPEAVTLEYVEIDASKLPVATADEAALRERYEQQKSQFGASEQRAVSHILVRVEAGADAAAQTAAERKATELAAQAKQPGADFAALARAQSDDAGSKAAGGDLGWIEKGVMGKEFEDAVFAMQPGEISGPVKTDFGWHVLQVREVKQGDAITFEQVREQLANELAETERERAFNEINGKLIDQILKNPSTLAPAARAAGLQVQTIGPFASGQGSGIAAHPAVVRAAFSDTLVQDGTVSDPIEIAPNHSVLIRVKQHTPARTLPLEQVGERVVAAVRGDRLDKAAMAAADAMVAAIRGGKSLQALATERGLVANELKSVPRGAPVPDAKTSEAIFMVPAPSAGKVTPGKVLLADGNYAVFAVSQVIPGDPKEATAQERAGLQQQLAQLTGGEDAEALLRALRDGMEIKVIESRL